MLPVFCPQVVFAGYSSISQEDILTLPDLFWKTGMFAAYEKFFYDNCEYILWQKIPNCILNYIAESRMLLLCNRAFKSLHCNNPTPKRNFSIYKIFINID